jgi:hypothetical protein
VDFGTGASLVQGQQLYGSAAVVGLQHQEQGFGSSSIPVQQQVIPQQAPAPLVPFQSQPALSSDTSLPSSTVVPIVEKTQPPGKMKKSWCWKCADHSHMTKDCKVKHYCYICDKIAHPTVRCPVLKAPRPTAYIAGSSLSETFTALPDSFVREELTPTSSPVARVVVSGDAVPAVSVARQVARRCADSPGWKWEAVASGRMSS